MDITSILGLPEDDWKAPLRAAFTEDYAGSLASLEALLESGAAVPLRQLNYVSYLVGLEWSHRLAVVSRLLIAKHEGRPDMEAMRAARASLDMASAAWDWIEGLSDAAAMELVF